MPRSTPHEQIFTLSMSPLSDLTHYPLYLRKPTVDSRTNLPHASQRHGRAIYDCGKPSSSQQSCTECLKRGQDCVRWTKNMGGRYKKCAFCTQEDVPVTMCHLEGANEPVIEGLCKTGRMKKRKLSSDLDMRSQTNDSANCIFSRFQVSMNPTPILRSVPTTSDRSFAPSPDPLALKGPPQATTSTAGTATNLSGSDATLERVTALENQVAKLEETCLKLRVKFKELESSNVKTPTVAVPMLGRAGEMSRMDAVRRPSTMKIDKVLSPVELPTGPATPAAHTVTHTEGMRPVNCVCALPLNGVAGKAATEDSNMADA